MRKILSFVLILAMVGSLAAGCGKKEEKDASPDKKEGTELDYPKQNINTIIQFSAGGPTDLSVRAALDAAGPKLPSGVNFMASNVTGGAGLVGLNQVATSKTDGYTLGCINVDLAINYALGRTDMSPEDFVPLACSIGDPYALVVKADAPYDTMEEFVEYVKAHPGEVSIGDSGVGAAPYLSAVAVADYFDLDYKQVSYDGSSDAVTAVVGGHIDGTYTQLSPAMGQLEAGGLKAIATLSNDRIEAWPDIPTVKETYPDVDFEILGWVFISAYKGTDPEICGYLEDVLGEAVKSEEFQTTLKELNMQNIPMTTEEAQEFIAEQLAFYKELCKDIKVE